MGQEFFINSEQLEAKVRSLLPSQGGAGAGFDLSASSQIIPIVDLTESAEGSSLRQDLQTAYSFVSSDSVTNTSGTSTLVSTTGYFKVNYNFFTLGSPGAATIFINDGTSNKIIVSLQGYLSGSDYYVAPVLGETMVFLEAGHTLFSFTSGSSTLSTTTRQIADIFGNLVNP